MRLLGDGSFIFAGLVAIIVLVIVAALALFRRGAKRPMESIRELEEKGLVVDRSFTARRAFQREELEDEGSHYFVELTDGSVLYLSGQYLYDYEPLDEDQARRFPCTEFTIRRHRDQNDVVLEVVCGGQILEPEVVAPPFDENEDVPEDGQILSTPYETLKARYAPSGHSTT